MPRKIRYEAVKTSSGWVVRAEGSRVSLGAPHVTASAAVAERDRLNARVG